MEKTFDSIGKALTSMAAVIVVLLFTICGLTLFSHSLFNEVFPAGMNSWEKAFATIFMAVAWEAAILITTVNSAHINRNIPAIMAICSGVVVLFFLHAFDSDLGLLTLLQRWFIGILVALVNWIYTDIFHSKWKERLRLIEQPMKLIQLESNVSDLQSALNKAQSKLKSFDELQRFKDQVTRELTCPHCAKIQSSYGTLHAHKGHCIMNPKNEAKFKHLNESIKS